LNFYDFTRPLTGADFGRKVRKLIRGRFSFEEKHLSAPAASALNNYDIIRNGLFLTNRQSPHFDGCILEGAPEYYKRRARYVDVYLYNPRARSYIPLKRFVSASPDPIEGALPDSTLVPSWRGDLLLYATDHSSPVSYVPAHMLFSYSAAYRVACAVPLRRLRSSLGVTGSRARANWLHSQSPGDPILAQRPLYFLNHVTKRARPRFLSERDPLSRAFRADGAPFTAPLAPFMTADPRRPRGFLDIADINRPAALTLGGRFGARAFEEKTLILNLTSAFYKVFGVRFTVYYYPLHRVFEDDHVMQALASRALGFLRTYITRQTAAQLWLSDFILLYYASVYLRTTDRLTRFIAKRLTVDKRWGRPWQFMFTIVRSLDIKKFGVSGIRFGFHGKFSARERAYRVYWVHGANPCLRNSLLTGSHSSHQSILDQSGVTHIHIWLTYF